MTRQDVYTQVTERIIAALESGTVPWLKPWRSVDGVPRNVRTGRPYRGVNVWLLDLAGFGDPRWGTYRAIQEAGGQVRKGERGTSIILWKPVRRGEDDERADYLLLRSYTVFNAEQCDGLPELERETESPFTPDERAEGIVRGYRLGPAVIHGASAAYYQPSTDVVRMPDPEHFTSCSGYYRTLFHELIHSTGHESRLKRLEPALFGTDPYAKEELVAELGASMLAGIAGLDGAELEDVDQSAAYIASWIRRLRDDRKLIVQAAAQAQKGADRILGTTFETATDETPAIAAAA